MILGKTEVNSKEWRERISYDRFKNIRNLAEDFYLEYWNNYLTISLIAEHYEITDELAEELINLGRETFENNQTNKEKII